MPLGTPIQVGLRLVLSVKSVLDFREAPFLSFTLNNAPFLYYISLLTEKLQIEKGKVPEAHETIIDATRFTRRK